MRKQIIDFILNNSIIVDKNAVYCDVTRFLKKYHGVKLIGKGTVDIVFSIWQVEDVLIYIELHGANFSYRFLN